MALDDYTEAELRQLASDNNIEGRTNMNKEELYTALNDGGFLDRGSDTTVEGFQEGVHFSEIPTTPSQFRKHQENPELPAERQSAPSPEQLNPQLFGPQSQR